MDWKNMIFIIFHLVTLFGGIACNVTQVCYEAQKEGNIFTKHGFHGQEFECRIQEDQFAVLNAVLESGDKVSFATSWLREKSGSSASDKISALVVTFTANDTSSFFEGLISDPEPFTKWPSFGLDAVKRTGWGGLACEPGSLAETGSENKTPVVTWTTKCQVLVASMNLTVPEFLVKIDLQKDSRPFYTAETEWPVSVSRLFPGKVQTKPSGRPMAPMPDPPMPDQEDDWMGTLWVVLALILVAAALIAITIAQRVRDKRNKKLSGPASH